MNRSAPTPQDGPILIVDDDDAYRARLVRAMEDRGWPAIGAEHASDAMAKARRHHPCRALVDLRMPGVSGVELIAQLKRFDPQIEIVVLTGYGSIATATEAIRAGAEDYLTKPADADQILATFAGMPPYRRREIEPGGDVTPSLARVEWEHIQRVLNDCHGNVSQAARVLGIHRRSLQRKLAKNPPPAV